MSVLGCVIYHRRKRENVTDTELPLEISQFQRHDALRDEQVVDQSTIPLWIRSRWMNWGNGSLRVLFVCTGNTCRSPMAEAIFRDLACKRLGCPMEKLREHEVDVLSAGVAAADNMPASPEAIRILGEAGLDLSDHLSQQVTEKMLTESDIILTMTPSHLTAIRNARPDLASRMRTLRSDGRGISDPIGYGIDEYRRCAQEITECLEVVLNDLIEKDVGKL